jgi:hypothetical protein
MKKQNPFRITKAGEFSDQEINDYWIDIYEHEKDSFLNPVDPKPKFLLGSKGCGKTHLLRFHSYPLQKIQHNNKLAEILKKIDI